MRGINAPAKKNARRIGALARLLKAPVTPEGVQEEKALRSRIVPHERALAVRTKKTRADGWSAARQARNSGRITR